MSFTPYVTFEGHEARYRDDQGYEIRYRGGRLADIHVGTDAAVDCVQVRRDFDWNGPVGYNPPVNVDDLAEALQRWVEAE